MNGLMREEETVREVVENAQLPDFVRGVQAEFDNDAAGDPAVWLFVTVSDDESESDKFEDHALAVLDTLRKAVLSSGIQRWPYIRFRSESEQAMLAEEEID